MTISVTNTLTRTKQELVPREPGKISMYVCGPTVYNHIHIGNARMALVFDTIRRYLAYSGYDVTYVENFTDVDDKIINKANESGADPEQIALEYSRAYEDLMERLGVSPPDIRVRATEHIDDMIAMIEKLIEGGSAYESGGNVWFAVDRFPGYGKLSGRTLDDVRAGERVEPDPTKRNPLDFSLWKVAKPSEPSWKSPWGEGRPGWHIECSAMSQKYLGMSFDIHGGGSDLIFPHHENEIAQAEAATGSEPFVRYWLHNGMVNVGDEKMAKSVGNFVLAKDALDELTPQVLRVMAIAAHYRSDVDFGPDAVRQAGRTIERFQIFLAGAGEGSKPSSPEAKAFISRFKEAMDDDFNTPLALSVLHDLVRNGNAEKELASRGDEQAAVRLAPLVGAFHELTLAIGIDMKLRDERAGIADQLLDLLVTLRQKAREDGRYEDADLIRDRLADLGVALEDLPGGTRWRNR